MQWAAWSPTWRAIQEEFGYPPEADLEAARRLRDLVPPRNRFRDVGLELRNRAHAVVAGCGPSLDEAPASLFAGRIVVAADGAAERLLELGLTPQVVVTDLDGRPEALAAAAASGAKMVVHAHGDNRDALAALVPRLGPQVYGTHQVEPTPELEPLRNVGGFTDGDRAVLLCEEMRVRRLLLVGFDFRAEPGRHSHRWDPRTKPRKLAWAERIVADAHGRGATRVERWVPAGGA